MELQGMFQWVLYSVVYALFLQSAFLPEPTLARARSPVEASSSSYVRAVTVFAISPIPAFFPYTGANRRGLSLFLVITTLRQTQSDSPGRRCMRIGILATARAGGAAASLQWAPIMELAHLRPRPGGRGGHAPGLSDQRGRWGPTWEATLIVLQ